MAKPNDRPRTRVLYKRPYGGHQPGDRAAIRDEQQAAKLAALGVITILATVGAAEAQPAPEQRADAAPAKDSTPADAAPVEDSTPADEEQTAPLLDMPGPVAEEVLAQLRQAVAERDHNKLGAALKAAEAPVPLTKDERMSAAVELLAQVEASA